MIRKLIITDKDVENQDRVKSILNIHCYMDCCRKGAQQTNRQHYSLLHIQLKKNWLQHSYLYSELVEVII